MKILIFSVNFITKKILKILEMSSREGSVERRVSSNRQYAKKKMGSGKKKKGGVKEMRVRMRKIKLIKTEPDGGTAEGAEGAVKVEI